jgi:hypothetical protein
VQLLVGDGMDERLKRRDTPGLNLDGSEPLDQSSEDGVNAGQVIACSG